MTNGDPGGRTLAGRYRLEHVIGRGGMSTVYRAQDLLLDRIVAVKRVELDTSLDEASREKFLNEARSTAALVHPSIVTLYDAIEEDGFGYLVMEYVDGRSLRDALTTGALPRARAVDIAVQLAGALQFAHRRGIAHGDIKPENIVIDESGRPKLLDFGIARLVGGAEALLTTVLGTALYVSPEQLEGHPAGERSDIYSLGLVLYEMLVGRLPFEGATPATVAAQRLVRDPMPLGQIGPSIQPSLNDIVLKAIARDPESRYQTVSDLNDALTSYQSGRVSTATTVLGPPRRPSTRPPTAAKSGGGFPIWAFVLVAALLLAGIAFGLFLGLTADRRARENPTPTAAVAQPSSTQSPATATPTVTVTASPTVTRTATPSPTPTVTPSATPTATPTASPSPTPARTPTPPPRTTTPAVPTPTGTVAIPRSAQTAGIQVVEFTPEVPRDATARLLVRAAPFSSCNLSYLPPGARSPAFIRNAGPRSSDANGMISWSWRIEDSNPPGVGEITVTCNDAVTTFNIRIT